MLNINHVMFSVKSYKEIFQSAKAWLYYSKLASQIRMCNLIQYALSVIIHHILIKFQTNNKSMNLEYDHNHTLYIGYQVCEYRYIRDQKGL